MCDCCIEPLLLWGRSYQLRLVWLLLSVLGRDVVLLTTHCLVRNENRLNVVLPDWIGMPSSVANMFIVVLWCMLWCMLPRCSANKTYQKAGNGWDRMLSLVSPVTHSLTHKHTRTHTQSTALLPISVPWNKGADEQPLSADAISALSSVACMVTEKGARGFTFQRVFASCCLPLNSYILHLFMLHLLPALR